MGPRDVGTPFRILSLDGGGSLGVYSLGVLAEIEAMLAPQPLHQAFDLIYGTSTGSIIGSLIALETPVNEIKKHYFKLAPDVMSRRLPWSKSKTLRNRVDEVFGGRKFDAFSTNIGIVATNLSDSSPRIFKRDDEQALGRRGTFGPGFGCTIGDAVVASCAAYPFFRLTGSTRATGNPTSLTVASLRTTRPSSPLRTRSARSINLDRPSGS